MYVEFSTSDETEARNRIKRALGKYSEVDQDFVNFLCKKVEEGIIRIGDPTMYGNAPVYSTDKATPKDLEELQVKYKAFTEKC